MRNNSNKLKPTVTENNLAGSVTAATVASQKKDDGRFKPNRKVIKDFRKRQGLSQERMAEKTGLALKTIRNLETNPTYRTRFFTLGVLASFFGADPQTFIESENGLAIKLLTSLEEINQAQEQIITSAQKVLACAGSRMCDPRYLQNIESALAASPALIHYRTMAYPPFRQEFQDHLLKLVELRDPHTRPYGYKTTHISIYSDPLKQPEFLLCANETTAVVLLPSLFGICEYNTALLIQDSVMAEKLLNHLKTLYQLGTALETPQAILDLGIVQGGDRYV